jgi:DNA-binding IclR family transcriptional regulator
LTGVSSTEPLVRDRGVASVRRIGPVLDLFTADRPEWRMSEIARALSMPKSTTHALLGSMVEVGLLSLTPRRRYQLGWSLLSLGERMRVGLDFRRHAMPAMQELARAVHETVVLCALDRSSVVVVERVEGDHPMVRLAGAAPGTRAPAYRTACGLVLLAARPRGEVRALLDGLPALDALERTLDGVRHRGVAVARGELAADVAAIAAPLTDAHGIVVAAIGLQVPAYRFPRDTTRVGDALCGVAASVSRRLAA